MHNIMKNGYTLIESMIALAIIVILSVIIIIDYDKQKSDKLLVYAARQIADDIRIAQNSTVDILKYNGAVPMGGYGIRFSTASNTSYFIFADINGDKKYIADDDGIVKTLSLPDGIIFDSITTNIPTSDSAEIIFVPPYGVVYINEGNNSILLTVRIKKTNNACPSSSCKNIEFTSDGRLNK